MPQAPTLSFTHSRDTIMRLFLLSLATISLLLLAACVPEAQTGNNQWNICHAEPFCPDESSLVDNCTGQCFEVTECDQTILCQYHENCDAMPVCPPDADTLDINDDCPNDHTCTEHSICGNSILCAQPDGPVCTEPLTCPAGAEQVADPSECPQGDVLCYPLADECGSEVWCWEESQQCTIDEALYLDPEDCGSPECTPGDICDSCTGDTFYFKDGCGCGCFPREGRDRCSPSIAAGIGFCPDIVATIFTGEDCVDIIGCTCAGPDCDRFNSLEECRELAESCSE